MFKNTKKKIYIITIIVLFISIYFASNDLISTKATKNKIDLVKIRILNTTDLHGRLNSIDYYSGIDSKLGGLSRAYTLIESCKKTYSKENVFTFDIGDTLYDYSTEFINFEDEKEIQPIYRGMERLGYDAIILGNHDYDYGYEYLLNQLNGSNLRNKTIASNVYDSQTGEHPFNEYMLFTREMTSESGKKVKIKVGVIGESIPTLSAKTHSYNGILKTEDMVYNVKHKSQKLKELGADIIVVLAHTGMGVEEPLENAENVAYALTKIKDVDVVIGGHEHKYFPTEDKSSPDYLLAGVDKKTNLVNGKNLVLVADRAKGIGVIDLKLEVDGENKKIIDRKTDIKLVDDSIKEEKSISKLYGPWEKRLKEHAEVVIGSLNKNERIDNFLGLLEDNSSIQLVNDVKRHYGLKFACSDQGRKYKSYPIVAVSSYLSFGQDSIEDYVNIKGDISEATLGPLQPFNRYMHIYTITGAQLKEWLEWSASAYEDLSFTRQWSDETISLLMKDYNLKSLVKEEWINRWDNFFVFDGVEYEIDPSLQARYNLDGKKISNSNRITNITYNGEAITDKTKLLLVSDKIRRPVDANLGIMENAVLKGFNRNKEILVDYIKHEAIFNEIMPKVDYNWTLKLANNYTFISRIPSYERYNFASKNIFLRELIEKDGYIYYETQYNKQDKDRIGPKIILSPAKTRATGSPFEIGALVTSPSKIDKILYIKGREDINSGKWYSANQVKNNSFTVKENGVYTVLAVDSKGNRSIKSISISNFSDELLEAPRIDTYTNRKSLIQGTAEPGVNIIFETYTGIYKSKVGIDGRYSYSLPAQPSGSEIVAYSVDEESGKHSEHTSIIVKRTGPNQPSINPIYNNVGYITGSINDEDATVIVVIDDVVYLADEEAESLYKKCTSLYKPSQVIVRTNVDISSSEFYTIELPAQLTGKKVKVYNLDHLSRPSRMISTKVIELAPNAPVIYDLVNVEKGFSGYVPGKMQVYEITVIVEDEEYKFKTDKNGKFDFELTSQLYANQEIYVYANYLDSFDSQTSYITKVVVKDIEDYVKKSSYLYLDKIKQGDRYIDGFFEYKEDIYIAIASGNGKDMTNIIEKISVDDDGEYIFRLDEPAQIGTRFYVIYRFYNGKILYVIKEDVSK